MSERAGLGFGFVDGCVRACVRAYVHAWRLGVVVVYIYVGGPVERDRNSTVDRQHLSWRRLFSRD